MAALREKLQPVLDQLAALQAALVPYEQIKEQLSEARARYHTLTDEFVNELKSRCGAMNDEQKRVLVLELFAQDVQDGLDAAVAEKRQELVRFMERENLQNLDANRDHEPRSAGFPTGENAPTGKSALRPAVHG